MSTDRNTVADPGGQLPRVLGRLDALAFALGAMAPTFTIGVGLGVIAGLAGASLPAAFVVAMLPMLGVASGFWHLNTVESDCGTAYVWVGRHLSAWLGFLCAWVQLVAAVVFTAYGLQIAGQATLALLAALGIGVDVQSVSLATVIGLGWLVLVTLTVVRGTELSGRLQRWLVVLDVGVVLVICALALIRGDARPVSLSWLGLGGFGSGSSFVTAMVIVVYVYWGWESAFKVSEDSHDSREAGRAGLQSIVVILAVFVFAAFAFQHAIGQRDLEAQGAVGLPFLGHLVAGRAGEIAASVGLLLSVLAILQASAVANSRSALAMGRDGVLPAIFTRLHPRFRTPAAGVAVLAAVSAVLALVTLSMDSITEIVLGSVTSLGILVLLYYAVAGIGCARAFWPRARRSPRLWLTAVLLPGVSAVAMAALAIVSIHDNWTSVDHLAFSGTNGRFIVLIPAVVLALGVLAGLYAAHVRKAAYFQQHRPRTSATLEEVA